MSEVGLHNAAESGVSAQPDAELHAALGRRSIVLVGMMGAGKSSIGRRLATRLGIPFVDADTEIEKAAGMTIPEIFAAHGEPYFRAGEQRVIARLLDSGPQVLATGGGAGRSPARAKSPATAMQVACEAGSAKRPRSAIVRPEYWLPRMKTCVGGTPRASARCWRASACVMGQSTLGPAAARWPVRRKWPICS